MPRNAIKSSHHRRLFILFWNAKDLSSRLNRHFIIIFHFDFNRFFSIPIRIEFIRICDSHEFSTKNKKKETNKKTTNEISRNEWIIKNFLCAISIDHFIDYWFVINKKGSLVLLSFGRCKLRMRMFVLFRFSKIALCILCVLRFDLNGFWSSRKRHCTWSNKMFSILDEKKRILCALCGRKLKFH